MKSNMNDLISIIILTKNEINNIRACLDAIFEQNIKNKVEVLIIDSGSTDGTLGIIEQFTEIKLLKIKPEDFGHGKTRNMGAEHAKGKYLVFLNADAIPVDNNWLSYLIHGFENEDNIAGIFSRHLPKKNCYLYMVSDLQRSMPQQSYIRAKQNALEFICFSTVSCVIPRIIWEKYPFNNEIIIAEDQQWADLVLKNGLKIAYQAESMVYHSHNYSFSEMYEIKYKVARSSDYFNNRFSAIVFGLLLAVGGLIFKSVKDILYIFFGKHKQLTLKQKIKELNISLKARAATFAGKYRGWIDQNSQQKQSN